MIKEWITEYNPKNEEEILDALREIMQEITLAALSRTDFFEKAGFYGGTALRIFYGLDRFSEDLDFSLMEVDEAFTLEPYFSAIHTEFESLGIKVSIKEKEKLQQSSIESAFLKTETIWKELVLVDVVKRLFAGKLHALLYRKWNNRVKGRDWYDLEWYIKKGIPLDVDHFLYRAKDTGDWKAEKISREEIIELLLDKIDSVSFSNIKEDVVRFIKDDKVLSIWSTSYFKDLVENMKFENTFK
ncbi:MAG: nucleotidyl transferase AbiEii/AbiGii toxin family protein [Flavobacteriia bacterium]|nr:nucleotidyl transferase AbiEii/AbiGii toxin family protein [Flavobacteriia bacterium]